MAADKNSKTIFISATEKENADGLKKLLYDEVRRIHVTRYPYDKFLFDTEFLTSD
jgi:GTP-binding protein HflX